ncbi:MAG: hypothetical protein U0869_19940 [Chloroflexota bacterium]
MVDLDASFGRSAIPADAAHDRQLAADLDDVVTLREVAGQHDEVFQAAASTRRSSVW